MKTTTYYDLRKAHTSNDIISAQNPETIKKYIKARTNYKPFGYDVIETIFHDEELVDSQHITGDEFIGKPSVDLDYGYTT